MDDEAIEREILRGRRRRWPWVVLAVVLVLGTAFGIFRYALHRRVVVELARIRAMGYPTTLAELDAWYPMPSGPNAADVYVEAYGALVRDEELEELLPRFDSGARFPKPDEPLGADLLAAAGAYLAQNERTLALLKEAAAIPECRFRIDLETAIYDPHQHLSDMKRGVCLLRLQAMVQARRGQQEQSVDSVVVMLALARAVRQQPILRGQGAGNSIHRFAGRVVEQLIGRASLSDGQLLRLSEAFAGARDRGALPRVMSAERVQALSAFDHEPELTSGSSAFFRRITGVSDADRAACLRIMGEIIESAEQPQARPVDIEAQLQAVPSHFIITRAFVPSMAHALLRDLRAQAAVRALLTGLAAKRYQLAHGELPERLDSLVPDYLEALPTDPFDGKPLRCEPNGTGAIVYSVGKDGVDDGGKELGAQGRPLQNGADVVFTIRR